MSTIPYTASTSESFGNLNYWITNEQEKIVKSKTSYTPYLIWLDWSALMELMSEKALLQTNITTPVFYEQTLVQKTSDITSQIEIALKQILQQRVFIPQPAEVRNYLTRYPDMIDISTSVCKTISERFGIQARLFLEVYHDPEIEDEYLTLYVRQEHYDVNILDMIENISTKYDEELAGKSGWLLVTTDFQPPRPR